MRGPIFRSSPDQTASQAGSRRHPPSAFFPGGTARAGKGVVTPACPATVWGQRQNSGEQTALLKPNAPTANPAPQHRGRAGADWKGGVCCPVAPLSGDEAAARSPPRPSPGRRCRTDSPTWRQQRGRPGPPPQSPHTPRGPPASSSAAAYRSAPSSRGRARRARSRTGSRRSRWGLLRAPVSQGGPAPPRLGSARLGSPRVGPERAPRRLIGAPPARSRAPAARSIGRPAAHARRR